LYSGYTFGSHYASGVISSVLPPFDFNIGSFNFSISPSIAIGKGWGFGANVSATFHAGDFAMSAGMGIMNYGAHAGSGQAGWEYRKSAMLSYDNGKFGVSFGSNWWSGSGGMAELNQKTGLIGFNSGDLKLNYENDGGFGIKSFGLGDRVDSYRSAAFNLSIGNFSMGINLFTGYRGLDNQSIEAESMVLNSKGKLVNPIVNETDDYNRKFKYGFTNEIGTSYRFGAAYFGYNNFRIGTNSEHIRHAIQNKFIHGLIKDRGFKNQS